MKKIFLFLVYSYTSCVSVLADVYSLINSTNKDIQIISIDPGSYDIRKMEKCDDGIRGLDFSYKDGQKIDEELCVKIAPGQGLVFETFYNYANDKSPELLITGENFSIEYNLSKMSMPKTQGSIQVTQESKINIPFHQTKKLSKDLQDCIDYSYAAIFFEILK